MTTPNQLARGIERLEQIEAADDLAAATARCDAAIEAARVPAAEPIADDLAAAWNRTNQAIRSATIAQRRTKPAELPRTPYHLSHTPGDGFTVYAPAGEPIGAIYPSPHGNYYTAAIEIPDDTGGHDAEIGDFSDIPTAARAVVETAAALIAR